MTRKTAPASRTSAPPATLSAIPTPPDFSSEAAAVADAPGASFPGAGVVPPPDPVPAPVPVRADVGGTSSPTGVTFPAAAKPQSSSRAVSL
ncbi:hypothetical protein BN2537_6905 [Streptomyces venezuelae]|nr:hypothetical protein BN2537_6905 [Streptomyces venezuelae]